MLTSPSNANATASPAMIGLAADHLHSKQTLFLWGLLSLTLTTLGFALGRSLSILVVTRILQGFSSAVVFGIGATILLEAVGKDRMGSVSGLTGMVVGLGLQAGPVVGGLLYEHAGYFAVFLPAFGLLIIDIMLRLLYLPGYRHDISPDIKGRSVEAQEAQQRPFKEHEDGERERHRSTVSSEREPLLRSSHSSREPLRLPDSSDQPFLSSVRVLVSSPRFLTLLLAGMYLNAIPAGLDATMPVYLRAAFEQNSAQTVPFFMCLCAPILFAPLVGLLSDHIGSKVPAAVAFTAYTLGMLGLAQITPHLDHWRPFMLCLLVVVGIGGTFGFPPVNADVGQTVAAIEERKPESLRQDGAYASAYSLLTAATAAGTVVGPMYAGLVRDRFGWSWTMASFGLVSILILTLVLLFTGGAWSHRQRDDTSDPINEAT